MPRRPPHDSPYHPAQDHHLRIGVLYDDGDVEAPVGHVLVVCDTWWHRLSGFLWWRRWGAPDPTADVSVVLHGEWNEIFLREEDLRSSVRDWARGRWVEDTGEGRSTYRLTWVPEEDTDAVAEREFGTDLGWLRQRYER